jgi:hypothetical protein
MSILCAIFNTPCILKNSGIDKKIELNILNGLNLKHLHQNHKLKPFDKTSV